MEHVNGKLAFSGRRLEVDAKSAQTLGIQLNNIHAVIPYLGNEQPQVLTVGSDDIHADFSQGWHYIHAKSVRKEIRSNV